MDGIGAIMKGLQGVNPFLPCLLPTKRTAFVSSEDAIFQEVSEPSPDTKRISIFNLGLSSLQNQEK